MKRYGKALALILAAILIAAAPAFAEERLDKPLSQVLSDLRLERHIAGGGDPEEAPEATLDNSYGLIVYASGDGGIDTVACDLEGKPILTGMSARGIATRLNIAVQPITGAGGVSLWGAKAFNEYGVKTFSLENIKANSVDSEGVLFDNNGNKWFMDNLTRVLVRFNPEDLNPDDPEGFWRYSEARPHDQTQYSNRYSNRHWLVFDSAGNAWFRDGSKYLCSMSPDGTVAKYGYLNGVLQTRTVDEYGLFIDEFDRIWYGNGDTSTSIDQNIACFDTTTLSEQIFPTERDRKFLYFFPDGNGNIVFTNQKGTFLASPNGSLSRYTHLSESLLEQLAKGDDGRIWSSSGGGYITRMDSNLRNPVSYSFSGYSNYSGRNLQSDGNNGMWFVMNENIQDNENNTLSRVDSAGNITYFPGTHLDSQDFTIANDGSIYFVDYNRPNHIARYDESNLNPEDTNGIWYIDVGCPPGDGITVDEDHNIWFTDKLTRGYKVYSPAQK